MMSSVKGHLRQGSTGQEVFSDWVIKGSNKRFNDHCVTNCSSVCSGQRVKQPIDMVKWSSAQMMCQKF